jgi:hypothetical protein
MKLWLDDIRDPAKRLFINNRERLELDRLWTWVKTADRAIELLATGDVTFASLDHDLAPEHYAEEQQLPATGAKTGYDVVCWMEEHDVWPVEGVVVHSQNPAGRARMEQVIRRHYGGQADAGMVL